MAGVCCPRPEDTRRRYRDVVVLAFGSLDELTSELESRAPFKSTDSLSGSRFEVARFRGEDVILKYICVDDDWIMRATGDVHCRQLTLFQSGALERLPATIDHAILAVAPYTTPSGHRGGAFLMCNLADRLIPAGSDAISLGTHTRFLEHMSDLHAAYWHSSLGGELFPFMHQYMFLTPTMAVLESKRGGIDPVPRAVADGWVRMRHLWPGSAGNLEDLSHDPSPLVAALAETPATLLHGDWKLGNLGEHPDGRTILLDWDRTGSGPATFELAWYLAVNCDRLPHTKEDAIEVYRRALQRNGVDTEGWWPRQLALSLAGAMLMLGWSKVDQKEEFGWWQERFREGLAHI